MEAALTLLDLGVNIKEIPESLILLPRTTALDDRILAMQHRAAPWPLSTREIYQTCFQFKERLFLPIPVTARILDMAELWVQSSVTRNDVQVYDTSTLRKTYLQSAPIIGRITNPV